MTISCADITRLPGLETIRFRAGLKGAGRVVRWPYIAENESISLWINGGELVFVTGINLLRSEESLCSLIRECVEHHVAGLVVLTGDTYIRAIPQSVLRLANALNFPLLEQPYALKMVTVTEVISQAIVQDNLLGQSVRIFLTRLMNGFADAPELIHLRSNELGLADNGQYSVMALGFKNQTADQIGTKEHLYQHTLLEQELNELLRRRNNHWPVLVCEQDFIVLWPSGSDSHEKMEDADQALKTLSRLMHGPELSIGISDSQVDLISFSQAVEQARQALSFAINHSHQSIFLYEQLGICTLFAAIPQRHLLVDFCQKQLGKLCFSREPRLIKLKKTLHVFLSHSGHHVETAYALEIHRNTLTNRLKAIEKLTERDLNDAFQRLNLQNALLIEQMLLHHHSIGN
ncbi:PucR family transcriptional regulator [Nitrincola alkalilacustris]|uniref:PucR family transcriptional regulator n=1 Tax=Nitrincola alkalilacustris TaxID=1571224 RepID=UPI00124CCF31|nr:PucR family transcriptional regulator ligand-binding domain-containing protein [Nitrincola alkalilacustris]